MGNSESKQNSLLVQWSPDDVSDAVVALGTKYEGYAEAIRENGIDGGLLASMDQEELEDTFEELGVSSKLHRKIMTRALLAVSKEDDDNDRNDVPAVAAVSVSASTDGDSPTAARSSSMDNKEAERGLSAEAYALAAESYGLTSFSPGADVVDFHDISSQIMERTPQASYGGIHLVLRDGQHMLSGKIRTAVGGCVPVDRSTVGVLDHAHSLCSKLVRESDEEFVICDELDEYKPLFGPTYVGHVIKNDKGDRLGAVCHVSTVSVEETQRDAASLRRTSAKLADLVHEQLRLREQLLMRNQSLQDQINSAREAEINDKREEEKKEFEVESTTPPVSDVYVPNSALLPFARTNLASQEERAHLVPTFNDTVDAAGMPRVPIGKHDMERVARVEALGLHNMDPDGPMARQLKQVLAMCASIFNRPIVTLSIHNHKFEFLLGCFDSDMKLFETMNVLHRQKGGSPFCVSRERGVSPCNYTTHKRSTFMVPDLWEDEAFKQVKGLRGYVGTPIIASDGHVVANLCMLDVKPRPDFSAKDQMEFEKIALLITQNIENWELRRMMDKFVDQRSIFTSTSPSFKSKKRVAPTGAVTIVLTDIQGSTALWEADAVAMKEALVVHDQVLRKCSSQHNGYEIKTEGDAFHLAFHDPVDAIGFALQAQIDLYQAPWSDNILALADAADDEYGLFRGPRVRMGVHHGPSTPQVNEVSGRASYSGETFRLTKSIEALCYGGQILASAETWRTVSELRERLGNPQVVDYGEYVLMTGESACDGIIAKDVVQLVPKRLAFDYFHHSGGSVTNTTGGSLEPGARPRQTEKELRGRQFPRSITKKKLTTSFLDAPNKNGEVTMMFIYPHGVDDFSDSLADRTFSVLTKVVRSLLLQVSPPGYECQEDKGKWMIAFESIVPAVNFGLLLMEAVGRAPFDREVDPETLIRVGIHSGAFSGMCPHPMTGRADYFGPVVNRAARVTAAAEAGKVYVGIPATDPEVTPERPDFGPAIAVNLVGVKELKGVTVGMALFCCEDKVKRRVSLMIREISPEGKRSIGNRMFPPLPGKQDASKEKKEKKPKSSILRSLRGRKAKQ